MKCQAMKCSSCVRPVALVVLIAAALIGSAGPAAIGAPDLGTVERDFLRTRAADRLLSALDSQSTPPRPGLRALAAWAAGQPYDPRAEVGEGPVADLARAVAALRLHDLNGARKALGAAAPGGTTSAWTAALLHLRRGDDDGAMSLLLAPPLFTWQRDAFGLALLGAALPGDDRRMLAAGAMGALERCAARGRTLAVESMALALAALHPEPGRRAFVFALRTFRRGGQEEQAQRLLASADGAGISRADAGVALEVALTAWERGDWKSVPGLLATRPPPAGARAAYLALQHAQRRGRVVVLPPALSQVGGEGKGAPLVARLATALGHRTTAAEVAAWSKANKDRHGDAARPRAFLSSCGFDVLTTVGDGAAGEAMLAAGFPFLLYRILRTDAGYREVATLVRGFDRRTGLWLLDEPDGHRIDITPRADVAKARLLCAVPQDRSALLAPLRESAAARRGQRVESALDAAGRGQFESAAARLSAAGAGSPVEYVYAAYVLLRGANETRNHAWLEQSRESVERSRKTPPLLGIEAYVRGQALGVAGDTVAAIGVFDNVVRIEGPSATVAMARFAALDVAQDQAGALAAVTEAHRLAPLDSRILYYRAAVRGRAGDLAGARVDLRRALEREPEGLRIAGRARATGGHGKASRGGPGGSARGGTSQPPPSAGTRTYAWNAALRSSRFSNVPRASSNSPGPGAAPSRRLVVGWPTSLPSATRTATRRSSCCVCCWRTRIRTCELRPCAPICAPGCASASSARACSRAASPIFSPATRSRRFAGRLRPCWGVRVARSGPARLPPLWQVRRRTRSPSFAWPRHGPWRHMIAVRGGWPLWPPWRTLSWRCAEPPPMGSST